MWDWSHENVILCITCMPVHYYFVHTLIIWIYLIWILRKILGLWNLSRSFNGGIGMRSQAQHLGCPSHSSFNINIWAITCGAEFLHCEVRTNICLVKQWYDFTTMGAANECISTSHLVSIFNLGQEISGRLCLKHWNDGSTCI